MYRGEVEERCSKDGPEFITASGSLCVEKKRLRVKRLFSISCYIFQLILLHSNIFRPG